MRFHVFRQDLFYYKHVLIFTLMDLIFTLMDLSSSIRGSLASARVKRMLASARVKRTQTAATAVACIGLCQEGEDFRRKGRDLEWVL